jgi:signal peptidase I
VAVAEGSMLPTIEPGDWLLVDPTTRRWPRRGSIVVFREPGSDLLAIKRVAGRPGDWVPFADGWLQLTDDEAWLLSDAAAGVSSELDLGTNGDRESRVHGAPIDSRRYGPVPVTALVGRAWLRYWPLRRVGLLDRWPRIVAPGRHAEPGDHGGHGAGAGREELEPRAGAATTGRDEALPP